MKTNQILTLIQNNSAYLLVAIIFIVVFAYGKNIIDPNKEKADAVCVSTQAQMQDGANYYFIDNYDSYVNVSNALNTSPGDFYRVKLVVEATPNVRRIESNSNEKAEEYNYVNNDYPYRLVANLFSDAGGKQEVGTIEVKQEGWNFYEFTFRANDRYSDIVFSKGDISDLEKVFIRRIEFSRLNIVEGTNLESLPATIQSISFTSVDDVKIPDSVPKEFTSLNKKNALIKDSFTAKGNGLESVYYYLENVGNGGYGDYAINIYESADDNFAVTSSPIQTLKFQFCDLPGYRYRENLYKFPISAYLEKGKRYTVALDNVSASVNRSNYFRVGKIGYQNDQSISVIYHSEKMSDAQAGSYSFLSQTELSKHGSNSITDNSTIENLGGGLGEFSYKSDGDFRDVFATVPNSYVFFDQFKKAVISTSPQKDPIEYVFNTIYPIKNLHFELKQVLGVNPRAKVEFSFDEENWQSVDERGDLSAPYLFSENLSAPDGKFNKFYIKVSAADDINIFENNYVGVYDLKVGAELVM